MKTRSMVMPSRPFRQHCKACHWLSPVIAPHSDALSPADLAAVQEVCPRCGSQDLQYEAVSGMAVAALSVADRLIGRRS